MIKLTNVTKIYKTGVRALNDVNLTIEPGEFVYVIGTTGAGKSTFIKLLYREEKPTSGKVEVVGQDVSKIKNSKVPYFRRNIGVVFQNFRLLPKKTVFENVAYALEVIDTPRVEIRRRVRATLELVADEPTGNLDPETSKEIINVLMRINEEQGTTVLVVTHDQKIVQEHKKRTILMEDGCINADTSLGGYDL